jgi:hypothetical protein
MRSLLGCASIPDHRTVPDAWLRWRPLYRHRVPICASYARRNPAKVAPLYIVSTPLVGMEALEAMCKAMNIDFPESAALHTVVVVKDTRETARSSSSTDVRPVGCVSWREHPLVEVAERQLLIDARISEICLTENETNTQ